MVVSYRAEAKFQESLGFPSSTFFVFVNGISRFVITLVSSGTLVLMALTSCLFLYLNSRVKVYLVHITLFKGMIKKISSLLSIALAKHCFTRDRNARHSAKWGTVRPLLMTKKTQITEHFFRDRRGCYNFLFLRINNLNNKLSTSLT